MNTTTNPCTLSNTLDWFQKAAPAPTVQNFTTQLGVHYEEVVESLEELTGATPYTVDLINDAKRALSALGDYLKANAGCVEVKPENRLNFLDSLCDQIVTATGTAHMGNYDVIGAMAAVNESNFSKFVDGQPIFNENMKVMKGPNYVKPALSHYLQARADKVEA